ncbi:MAG: multiheme c-type cytochrome [bacterium]
MVVDLGDFFGNRMPAQEKKRTTTIVDAMRMIKYDVVTIGERELNYGMDYLKESIGRGKYDVVCANLRSKTDSSLVFQPYVIKKAGDVRVGFLGLLDDDPRKVGVFEQLENVYASSYMEAAEQYLPEVRSKADIVVALAHIGLGASRTLAEKLPGFDVVLVGHGPDRTPLPEKIGETIVVKSEAKSSSIGTLLLGLDSANRIGGFEGLTETLSKKGRLNPDVDKLVKDCEQMEQQRDKLLARRKLELPNIPRRPEVVAAEGYLGWETCKVCHGTIYDKWSTDPHSHAFATLAEDDKWNDPACLPCHTTGYEFATAKGESIDVRPEMWNVQCEACHGMGTKHQRGAMAAAVPEDACRKCHTVEWSPNFDYQAALKKIDHGKDAMLKREIAEVKPEQTSPEATQ